MAGAGLVLQLSGLVLIIVAMLFSSFPLLLDHGPQGWIQFLGALLGYLILLSGLFMDQWIKPDKREINPWRRELISILIGFSPYIFITAFVTSSFGMMPLEAMACGIPTIVFKETVLEELTDAPNIGTAVNCRDSQALGIAIEEMLSNPEGLNNRSRDGIKFVREKYAIENYVRQHIHLYNSLS